MMQNALIAEIDIDNIPDDYEAMCDVGRVLAGANDRNRWVLGRLGQRVVKRYGEDVFGDFANDIGMIPKTLYSYREMVDFYGDTPQTHWENSPYGENLQWTHYRAAKRLDNLEAALCALEKASKRNRTASYFQRIISRFLGEQKKKAKKLVDTVGKVTALSPIGEMSVFMDGAQTAKLHAGTDYRIVIYEVIE